MATYTVKPGDSWWKIAQQQLGDGAKYAELARFNNANLNKTLFSGQTINIPDTTKSAASPTSTTTPNVSLAKSSGGRPAYTPGQNVTDAENALNDWMNQKPGDYNSQYQDKIDQILDDLLNGKQPAYDFSTDPIYQQYKDNYIKQGQMAMMDTMANAAALSGGYGNSYATTVGNQAYQAYLSELNNVIPELANAAFARYQAEQEGKRANVGILQGLEESAYGKYRDELADWYTNRDYLTGRYDTEYQKDYGSYRDQVSDWEADRAYEFQQEQARLEQERWEREYALSKAKAYSSGGGSSGSGKTDSSQSPFGNMTDAQIKRAKNAETIEDCVQILGNAGLSDEQIINGLYECGWTQGEIKDYYNTTKYSNSNGKGPSTGNGGALFGPNKIYKY